MTDEQIVNWWKEEISIAECFKSDYRDGIKVDVIKQTVDLINRQKADNKKLENIERLADKTIATLTAENDILIRKKETLRDEISALSAKIERLQGDNVKLHTIIPKMLVEAKFEAIRDFAERLKKSTITKFDWNDYVEIYKIDNLVKEMVGD